MSSDLGVLNKASVTAKRRGMRRGGGRRSTAAKPTAPAVETSSDEDINFVDAGFCSFTPKQTPEEIKRLKEDKIWEQKQKQFIRQVQKIDVDVKPNPPPASGEFDGRANMVTAYSFDPEKRDTKDVLKDYLQRRFEIDRLYRKQDTPEDYVEQLARNDRHEDLKTAVVQEPSSARFPPLSRAAPSVTPAPQAPVRQTENQTVPCMRLFVDETDRPLDKTHYDVFSKFADRLQLQVENLSQLMPAHTFTSNAMQRQMDLIQEQLRLFKLTVYNCTSH